MAAVTIFLIGYGVILAKENYDNAQMPQDTQVTDDDQGDIELGSIEEQVAGDSDEEFPLLERDMDKFENLVATQEKEVTPITPETISIPSLGIDADIIQVGILEDGAMEVPENVDEVGWFEPGVKPGQVGNSVLAGHVDSHEGPAIFFELRNIQVGDEIIVSGSDGEPLTFAVTSMETYPTDGAPISEIFGPSNGRNLNLITCTGPFNRETGQYPDRLVVYTELVEEEPEELEYIPTSPTNVQLAGSQFSWHAVRDNEVVGYRVYEELEDGSFEHIESISYFERKSIVIENPDSTYVVSSVSIDGKESEKAGVVVEEEVSE